MVRRRAHRRGPDADRRAHRVPRLPAADPHGRHDGHVHGDHDPAGVGLRRADHGGAADARHGRAAARPGHPAALRRPADLRRPDVPLPGCGRAGAARRVVHRAARADDGDHRQHRRGQDDAGVDGAAAVRRHRPAPCSSTAWTCARSSRTTCGGGSGSCRSGPTSSPGPSPATCATATPTPPTTSCGPRWRWRRGPTSCGRCPTAWTRRSPRAAPTSPAASVSGSRSPARWCAGPRSTSSTTRSPRSTSPPTRGCGRPCGRSPPTATVVIVAQRVSTIADADQIVVLDDGMVVGIGTPRGAAGVLPDLRRDRRVAARSGRGRGMSTAARTQGDGAAEPAAGRGHRLGRARDGRAAPRRRTAVGGRRPARGEGVELRPVGAAAGRPAAARPLRRRRRARARRRSRVALNVVGPKILGTATDVIFAGVIGKQLPGGHHRRAGRRRGAGRGQRHGRG